MLTDSVEKLPRRKPFARLGDGLPQSYLAISKDVHRPTSARHRDIKLCFIGLAKRPDWDADNDLVDSLGLACVTCNSHSLVEMQSGAAANNLAFVEYDPALINTDHGPNLVVQEVLPAMLHVFREPDPVANRDVNILPLEHAELPRLVQWQLLLDAILPNDDSSLLSAKDLPLLAAFKALFLHPHANSTPGHPMKFDNPSWLISESIALLGLGQIHSL